MDSFVKDGYILTIMIDNEDADCFVNDGQSCENDGVVIGKE